MSLIRRYFAHMPVLVLALLTPADLARADESPGVQHEIKANDLPVPYASKNAVRFMKVMPRQPNDHLNLPEGFEATLYAEGLSQPRWLAIAPNGDVFITEPSSQFRKVEDGDKITVLRDGDGDGVAEIRTTFARDFNKPMGIVFVEEALLVSDTEGVWRLPYKDGALSAETRTRLTPENAFGEKVGTHYQRVLALSPKNDYMFVTVGSTANVLEDPLPHATIQRFRLDGSEQATFATGLRNPIGIAFYPGTEDLYAVVAERDTYGDDLVPDYLTRVEEGKFYGWPYAYIGPNPDPKFGDKRPDLVAQTVVPDVLFQAHSTPIDLIFYQGTQFPEEYQGDAFVSLHGSWNKADPTGFKVVRVKFENGRPTGGYENFATGFLDRSGDAPRVWGRPAGFAVMPDGSLLIAEDGNDTIWRVSYHGDSE